MKEGKSPFDEITLSNVDPIWIEMLAVFDQVNDVPGILLVKLTGIVAAPWQLSWINWLIVTIGLGFTVIVKLIAVPKHPFKDGVTVKVAIWGAVVVFWATNDGIKLAEPLPAQPIDGLSCVQL